MGKFIDLTGQRFGRLVVIKRVESDKFNHVMWLCQCDCGNQSKVCSSKLKKTQSCGCLTKERLSKMSFKHGMYGTRINRIWNGMKRRCNNINNEHYKNYGERGIVVCEEWNNNQNGFINFYNWAMNNGYKDNLTIDRIDVNGNYEPNNCRWITSEQQQGNKRNNRYLTYRGETHTMKEWSRILNIRYSRIQKRIESNFPIELLFYKGKITPKIREEYEKYGRIESK